MKSVLILVLLVILLCNIMKNRDNFINEPCSDKLTDKEYLLHMIPHHQVAIDMSDMLIPNTKNPQMLHLCRDIIRKQGYEIWEMEMFKQKINDPITPDKVLLGLTFVNFFHLKIFPNKYPPISELIVRIIIQINKTKEDAVSFLK